MQIGQVSSKLGNVLLTGNYHLVMSPTNDKTTLVTNTLTPSSELALSTNQRLMMDVAGLLYVIIVAEVAIV